MFESKNQPVNIPAGANWTRLALFNLGGVVDSLVVDVVNSGPANPFTAFRVTRGAYIGHHGDMVAGKERVLLSGTDFNTATVELVDAVSSTGGPNLHQLPFGGWGQFKLEHLKGVAEIAVWAQSTLGTQGTVNAAGV